MACSEADLNHLSPLQPQGQAEAERVTACLWAQDCFPLSFRLERVLTSCPAVQAR